MLATCEPPCQNGAKCVAPQTCDCSGTGYNGTACEAGNNSLVLLTSLKQFVTLLVIMVEFVQPQMCVIVQEQDITELNVMKVMLALKL